MFYLPPFRGLASKSTVNGLPNSEALGSWTPLNATVGADAIVAPDGKTTADRLIGNANNSTHRASQASLPYALGMVTFSIYAKADQRSVALGIVSGSGFVITGFDLTGDGALQWINDSLSTRMANRNAFITKIGGGWYRCEQAVQILGGTTATCLVDLNNGSTNSFASSTSEGAYLWGGQFEPGGRAGPYVAT